MSKQKINLTSVILFILVIISIGLNLDTIRTRVTKADGVDVGASSVSSNA